ncbi:hypothetical protein SDC9_138165 [bioreactor metagenome]|uniref:Uncharacterized protein n=1 Tax=bioreactor metagenome TaxID=1076179 RepID=A0A645DNK2_9ZZZZ
MPCRKRFFVELRVARHVQTFEVDARGDDLRLAARLVQPARGARQVAAARVGADDHIRVFPRLRAALLCHLIAERLDARDAKRSIKGGVEIARVFEHAQHGIKQLRANRKLHHLRAECFALARFFDDLRLTDPARIVAFLHDDATKPTLRAAAGNRRTVVSARCGERAGIAHALCVVDARGSPAHLKAPAGVCCLVFHKDARAVAVLAELAHKRRDIIELDQRCVSDRKSTLNLDNIFQRIARGCHHFFIVERNRAAFKLLVINPNRRADDLALARHHGGKAVVLCRHLTPPKRKANASSPACCNSGTKSPKLCV